MFTHNFLVSLKYFSFPFSSFRHHPLPPLFKTCGFSEFQFHTEMIERESEMCFPFQFHSGPKDQNRERKDAAKWKHCVFCMSKVTISASSQPVIEEHLNRTVENSLAYPVGFFLVGKDFHKGFWFRSIP